MDRLVLCTKCGKLLDEAEATVCPACGGRVEQENVPVAAQAPTSGVGHSKRWAIVTVVLVGIAVLLVNIGVRPAHQPVSAPGSVASSTADKMSAEDLEALGEDYFYGRGVDQSDAEAVKCFCIAAEQGNALAQYQLGYLYDKGRGVEQNDTEAAKWYRKSAEQGNTKGQCALGFMYTGGRGGVEEDHTEAAKWYRKAAEQGNATAQFCLGLVYTGGHGVEQNDTEAVKWYRKAAEQGYVFGQCALGLMYENGRGVEQSTTEAVKWYRKAAEQGDEGAKEHLAELMK